MKAAIIGPPKSGKSMLFSAITGQTVDPYAVPEPHVGMVQVPDSRLDYLAKLARPKKVTPTTIEFIDVPGCSLDDAHGREEWRRYLPHVRQADLLVVVVREFLNPSVPPFRNRIDARADFEAVWEDMIFADLETVTTRIERLEKSRKKPTKPLEAEKREMTLLKRCQEALESEQPLSSAITGEEDRRQLASFAFLTEKPVLGVCNVSDAQAGAPPSWEAPYVVEMLNICASIEAELIALDPQEREAFLTELELPAPARERLIQSCYRAAGLISFLTMNPEEVRAWSIPQGATALDAAGKVHTDFARGFIRAETASFDDLVAHQDWKGAKAAGRVRMEGKGYIVCDGDILHILANP